MKPSISPAASMPEMVFPSGAFSSFTSGRQIELDLLGPARLLDAAAHPGHVGGLHAVIVLQDRARPDIGGQLIFRQADLLAFEVFRLLDAVLAHIDRGVAEGARQKHRNADIRAVVLRGLHREARERQFADVEFGRAEGAKEDFLRRQGHEDRIDAVDAHGAVDQRARAIIVADRDRQIQFVHFLFLHFYFAAGFSRIWTFFSCVKAINSSKHSSRPMPDCFQPPNGAPRKCLATSLTQT